MKKKHFFSILKSQNRKMYWAVLLFVLGSCVFIIIKIEAPPFYVYSMYSAPAERSDSHIIYEVICDGTSFNESEIWNHHRRIMFNYSIEFYDRSVQSDSTAADAVKAFQYLKKLLGADNVYATKIYSDKQDIRQYPVWLKSYMQSLLGKEFKEMKVYKVQVRYQKNGHLETISKTLLCEA